MPTRPLQCHQAQPLARGSILSIHSVVESPPSTLSGSTEWRRWFQTGAESFGRETERLAGMLLNEGMREGVREQIERTRQARQRWEERLTALTHSLVQQHPGQ